MITRLTEAAETRFADQAAWPAHLNRLGIVSPARTGLAVTQDPVLIATEGALWGSIQAHGFLRDAVVLSDDAGRFDVGRHALCRVHSERLVHKLDTFADLHRAAQQTVRTLIWNFYADLKLYQLNPSGNRRLELRERFDRIFRHRTGFATLDRPLKRLHAKKAKLLMVLDRPEIPLHTNGSENDIRCHVTRRKISAGTRSDAGRDCRDTSLALPRPAQSMAWHFGTIWAAVWASPANRSFRRCRNSSDAADSPPEAADARRFAPLPARKGKLREMQWNSCAPNFSSVHANARGIVGPAAAEVRKFVDWGGIGGNGSEAG